MLNLSKQLKRTNSNQIDLFDVGVRINRQRHDHRPERGESLRKRDRLGPAKSARTRQVSRQVDGARQITALVQVCQNVPNAMIHTIFPKTKQT